MNGINKNRKNLIMQVQVFSIAVIDNKNQVDELNRFLRGHKIIDIEK